MILKGIFTFGFIFAPAAGFGNAAQALMGLAAGASFSAGFKILAAWFLRDRGLAMGIAFTGQSLAILFVNVLAPRPWTSSLWQLIYEVMGAITLAWGALALLTLKNHPASLPQPPLQREKPEITEKMRRNINLSLLAIAGFGGMWALGGFQSMTMVLMRSDKSFSIIAFGQAMFWYGLGALAGKPIFGALSDAPFLSRKYLAMLLLAMAACLLIALGYWPSMLQSRLLSALLGMLSYSFMPILIALVCDNAGYRWAGASAGLNNTAWQAGFLILPIVGFFNDRGDVLGNMLKVATGPILAVVALAMLIKSKAKT